MRWLAAVVGIVVLVVPGAAGLAFQGSSFTVIASGLEGPFGMALDGEGNLFVTNADGTTISKIAPDGTASTFASRFDQPSGLAMDSRGMLYVSDRRNNVYFLTPSGGISPYISGEQVPLQNPVALAFDAADNLYVVNAAGYVSKFDSNRQVVKLRFAGGFTTPQAVAVYDATGTVFVSDSTGTIYGLDMTTGAVTRTIHTGHAGTEGGLVVDPAGNLYLADQAANVVLKINTATERVTTCISGIWQPRGLLLDNRGHVYVTSYMMGLIFQVAGCGVTIDSSAYTPYLLSCTVRARANSNLRAGPGTGFPVVGTIARREERAVDSRAVAPDGYVWWHLTDDSWIRGDLVTLRGACRRLPDLLPTATPN